jgi:hypothetical protein
MAMMSNSTSRRVLALWFLIALTRPCILFSRRILPFEFMMKGLSSYQRLNSSSNYISGSSDHATGRRQLAAVSTPTVDGHRVKNLPGLKSGTKIVHYAGHITVDEPKGGNLFYWLIEAEGVDPATGKPWVFYTTIHSLPLFCCSFALTIALPPYVI